MNRGMNRRSSARWSTLAFAAAVAATCLAHLGAECVFVAPNVQRDFSNAVFRGRLVGRSPAGDSGHVVVTFDVSRVWKGNVAKRVEVYQLRSIDAVELV